MRVIERKDVRNILNTSDKALDRITYLVDNYKSTFIKESYLTSGQLCNILHISPRALQDYRDDFIVPYIYFGGKVLYRISDIQEILNNNYHRAICNDNFQ